MSSTSHPAFARLYPRLSQAMDDGGMTGHRHELLSGLAGEVTEIGCGDGKNFPHYPPAVTRVRAVEPEPYLRRLARSAATNAAAVIEVTDGIAERLPLPHASQDAAVFALTLCTVQNPGTALHEARRVLRPGGQLRFLEHVRAGTPGLARVQRLLDATIWPHLIGGCHLGRDTAAAITRAGFTIDRLGEFLFPPRPHPGLLLHPRHRPPVMSGPSAGASQAGPCYPAVPRPCPNRNRRCLNMSGPPGRPECKLAVHRWR